VSSALLASTGHGASSDRLSAASGSDMQQGSTAASGTASTSDVPRDKTVGRPVQTAGGKQSRTSGPANRPAIGVPQTPRGDDKPSGALQSAAPAANASPYASLFQLPLSNRQPHGDRHQAAETPLFSRNISADPAAVPADMERWVPTAPVDTSAEPMRMQLERWSDETGVARSANGAPSAHSGDQRSGSGQESTPPTSGSIVLTLPLRAGSGSGDAAPVAGSAHQPGVGCKREEDTAVKPADNNPRATGDTAVSLPGTPRLGERTVARVSDFTSATTSLACAHPTLTSQLQSQHVRMLFSVVWERTGLMHSLFGSKRKRSSWQLCTKSRHHDCSIASLGANQPSAQPEISYHVPCREPIMSFGSYEARESIYAIARESAGSGSVGPAWGEAPSQFANGDRHAPTNARNFLASSSASRLSVCGHAAAEQLPSAALIAAHPTPAPEEAAMGALTFAVALSASASAATAVSVEAAPASLPTGTMAVVSAGD